MKERYTSNSLKFRRYTDSPRMLFAGLKKCEPDAIRYLHFKVQKHIQFKRFAIGASAEDTEELANDAILLTLEKISNGSYQFQGFSPLSFTLVIADNLMRNFSRKKHIHREPIEEYSIPEKFDVETYLHHKELEQMIKSLLDKMDHKSQLVIRLKYYDGMSDEEIVRRGLTPYTTTDSLKSKRCASLRKLSCIFHSAEQALKMY